MDKKPKICLIGKHEEKDKFKSEIADEFLIIDLNAISDKELACNFVKESTYLITFDDSIENFVFVAVAMSSGCSVISYEDFEVLVNDLFANLPLEVFTKISPSFVLKELRDQVETETIVWKLKNER